MSSILQSCLHSLSLQSNILICFRSHGRNILKRRPIKVLNVPSKTEAKPARTSELKDIFAFQEGAVGPVLTEKSELMLPRYTKIQKDDPQFNKLLTMVKSRTVREKKNKMLLEGKRLINDAICSGMELEELYFTRPKDLADIKLNKEKDIKICKVLYKTLKVWSDLTTCPGVMGIFKRPADDYLKVVSQAVIPVTLICDNIRDPGNLGSVIRNAAAAGCKNVLLMKGCVDPWESKVLRAGCGGHFRIPILNDIEWIHIKNYIPPNSTVFVADSSSDIEVRDEEHIFVDYDETEEDAEDKRYVELNEDNRPIVTDETYNEPIELEKYEDIDLPCLLYSNVKYPKENIFLYVGGETHGVNPLITKLACEFGGRKIKIPMENSMESLNSSFAMTIVLYEIKRQFDQKHSL